MGLDFARVNVKTPPSKVTQPSTKIIANTAKGTKCRISFKPRISSKKGITSRTPAVIRVAPIGLLKVAFVMERTAPNMKTNRGIAGRASPSRKTAIVSLDASPDETVK